MKSYELPELGYDCGHRTTPVASDSGAAPRQAPQVLRRWCQPRRTLDRRRGLRPTRQQHPKWYTAGPEIQAREHAHFLQYKNSRADYVNAIRERRHPARRRRPLRAGPQPHQQRPMNAGPVGPIIVGYDDSPAARAAMRWAADHATATRWRVAHCLRQLSHRRARVRRGTDQHRPHPCRVRTAPPRGLDRTAA